MIVHEQEKVIKRKVYMEDSEIELLSEMDNFLDELECCYDDETCEIVCQLFNSEGQDVSKSVYDDLSRIRNMIDTILLMK